MKDLHIFSQIRHYSRRILIQAMLLITISCLPLFAVDADFKGQELVGKQIVRAQNINFSGSFKKYSNNPEDFDLGQALRDGYTVMITFFRNDCINCRKEISFLAEMTTKYKEDKVMTILIDLSDAGDDRQAKTEKYLESLKLPKGIYYYYDSLGTIRKSYQVPYQPHIIVPCMFVIGRDYHFKYAHLGWVKKEKEAAFKKDFEKQLKTWMKK